MKQYRITAQNLNQDSDEDCYLAPEDPIHELKALKGELAKVQRAGYAINRGEWRDGVGGLAAVIYSGFKLPVAAVGISGPLDRLSISRMKDLVPMVLKCSKEVSEALGYRHISS